MQLHARIPFLLPNCIFNTSSRYPKLFNLITNGTNCMEIPYADCSIALPLLLVLISWYAVVIYLPFAAPFHHFFESDF